jgi:hypothetical protein
VVLKTLARRIAQTLDPFGDQGVDIALAVVTIHGEVAQEIGIETAGLK